ncbi:sensor histidine kinase [Paenibacillus flagellatus]|uniref:histidine kinase n=1 Tax=Paenibacillus flagellatus TaxID=2211139 RepID=A0A2V5K928_9BACL|nr:sensor histidine kinase [Paenibacillus flagellatus]PYI55928.1 hypothetical protein DLM86_09475 [Paenibacillus flagellatus]
MERLVAWFGSQPFRSFQLRLFVYLFLIGSVPVFGALTFFYVQSSERTESEWRSAVAAKHDRVQRRLDEEMRGLEFAYRTWLQDEGVRKLLRAGRENGIPDEATVREAKETIAKTASFQLGSNKRIVDFCFSFDGLSSFCAAGNPFDYGSRSEPERTPMNRSDTFVRGEGAGRIGWVGPLLEPGSYVVGGYMTVVADMARLLDDMRSDLSISDLALWDSAAGTVLVESGTANPDTDLGPAYFLAEKGPFLRSEGDVFLSQRAVSVPGQAWMCYMEVPNTQLRSLKSTLRNTVLVFFAILLVGSAVSSFVFSNVFARPIRQLRQLMKRAESGDLKAYWTSGGIREIDELGDSYNQMLNRLEETIKQAKQEESLKKEAEIEALQYQLNPHFLYNTLNTIKWVAKIHKTPQISEAVSALVRLLQASLGKKGDFLPLKEEIGLVQDYMAIQSFRYGDLVKLRLDVDALAAGCLVPKLLLQPLVENALLHGLENSSRGGEIEISAWLDRDMLLCQVKDNGKGMAEPETAFEPQTSRSGANERMSGIGLRNIRERVKLYYGPDYKMHVFSKPNEGTTVRISLPIHRSEEI